MSVEFPMDGLGSPSYRPYLITTSLKQQAVTRRVGITWTAARLRRNARAETKLASGKTAGQRLFFPPTVCGTTRSRCETGADQACYCTRLLTI